MLIILQSLPGKSPSFIIISVYFTNFRAYQSLLIHSHIIPQKTLQICIQDHTFLVTIFSVATTQSESKYLLRLSFTQSHHFYPVKSPPIPPHTSSPSQLLLPISTNPPPLPSSNISIAKIIHLF